jgi:NAD(P)-dependent dehydrogenase (short-subunit alcohol dehydrogenase family)
MSTGTEGTAANRDGQAGPGVAVVAGGGGPLGRATSLALSAAGFTVVAVDRNEQGLKELPASIRSEVADATDPAVPAALIDRIAAEVGPPAVLVSTIGAFQLGDALAATPDGLRLMMDVNLGAALWLSQAVAPHMRQRGSGAIVHVTSRPALEPTPGMAAYSLSKAALAHLIRVLDAELRPSGIRVNAVAPQLLDTPVNQSLFPPDVLKHAVEPEVIAGLIAFLVSDAAAPVSGAILPAYGA